VTREHFSRGSDDSLVSSGYDVAAAVACESQSPRPNVREPSRCRPEVVTAKSESRDDEQHCRVQRNRSITYADRSE
jgi:hypothetical protein